MVTEDVKKCAECVDRYHMVTEDVKKCKEAVYKIVRNMSFLIATSIIP